MESDKVLKVKDLTVSIGGSRVIDGLRFELSTGRVTALVGESGSGKTLTALAILDLLPGTAVREKGAVTFRGRNMFDLGGEELRCVRGNDIAMVFQEPFTALNPVLRVREQIAEAVAAHKDHSGGEVLTRTKDLLEMVKLPPGTASRYPHELSGGMRQRVMLAMALSCDPEILILDEPTTALDVSIQKEILGLIKRIQERKKLAILFITHDFSVVNMISDEVCVMNRGIMVERGTTEEVLRNPKHDYTKKLIGCIPRLGDTRERLPV